MQLQGDKALDKGLKEVYSTRQKAEKKHQAKKEKKKAAREQEERKGVQMITVSIRASPTHVHFL